jgi:hypothetical protein
VIVPHLVALFAVRFAALWLDGQPACCVHSMDALFPATPKHMCTAEVCLVIRGVRLAMQGMLGGKPLLHIYSI